MPTPGAVWAIDEVSWTGLPSTGAAEGVPDRGGAFDAGSCAHADLDPAEIPPVSKVVGFIKGKSAIHIARVYGERKRSFVGQHFLMTRRLDCRLTIWSNSHSRSGCKGSNSTAWANISQTGGMRQMETVGGSTPVSAESQQRPVERWARNVRFGSIADLRAKRSTL